LAFEEFEAQISTIMQQANSASVSIVVVYDQTPIYFKGFGNIAPGGQPAKTPTPDTIYRIASVTKVRKYIDHT
jgi:CubicO group peptidase (beta-lactamase class C family)